MTWFSNLYDSAKNAVTSTVNAVKDFVFPPSNSGVLASTPVSNTWTVSPTLMSDLKQIEQLRETYPEGTAGVSPFSSGITGGGEPHILPGYGMTVKAGVAVLATGLALSYPGVFFSLLKGVAKNPLAQILGTGYAGSYLLDPSTTVEATSKTTDLVLSNPKEALATGLLLYSGGKLIQKVPSAVGGFVGGSLNGGDDTTDVIVDVIVDNTPKSDDRSDDKPAKYSNDAYKDQLNLIQEQTKGQLSVIDAETKAYIERSKIQSPAVVAPVKVAPAGQPVKKKAKKKAKKKTRRSKKKKKKNIKRRRHK